MQAIEYFGDNIDRRAQTSFKGNTAKAEVERKRFSVEAKAEAFMGEAKAEASIFEARARGPSVGTKARAGLGGLGAGVDLTLGSVGVKTGFAAVEVSPNLNTGAHVGATGVSIRILGFGFSFGGEGVSLMLPLGSVSIGSNPDS